jgi:hypothetical protein
VLIIGQTDKIATSFLARLGGNVLFNLAEFFLLQLDAAVLQSYHVDQAPDASLELKLIAFFPRRFDL